MKAFFSKIFGGIKTACAAAWNWCLAHKVVAIVVASVLVVGTTLSIALPIALHNHDFATEWSYDQTNHWHSATCKHEEEKSDLAAHTYTNACDTTCDVCGHTRTVGAHVYDNDCDTACNVCGATREVTHAHGTTLTAGDTTHYYACSVCGDKKDEEAHVFDKTVAHSDYLKAAATTTTKAQYWKSCVCGKASATEYFETDKAPANLQVSDISKTYDGTPVAEPTVTFDGVGAENFEYYKGAEKLTGRPTDAGTYKVVVTVDETDTHAGDRVEREFTIAKKTLNYLEVTKVYNGKRGFGENAGIYCQLGVEHGVIAGDTVFLETSDDLDYNVGKYYFVRMNSDDDRDTVWLHGDDAANYDFQGNDVVGEVTVTPKALNLLDIKFTYDGGNIASRFDLTAADGVIAGDDVYLYGDGWQSYDVAYDEYTLTDDFSSDDYDEGVTLFGADKGNYKFTYDTDGSVGKITVMPYILDFTGEYVKDADGTHYFTFTQDVTWSYGGTDTVTVKIALVDLEAYWITAPGVYTQENAQIGDESFEIGGVECEGFELDEDYYADEFKVTVLSTDDLIMQVTDRFNIGTDYIISVEVKQGTVKVGDSIVLPGATDKVYEVLAIEKFHDFLEYATVGDKVGLYVDGMAELTEVTRLSFMYEAGNIPEMATEFLAKLYLKTKEEGGRQNPAFNGYAPTLRGLGVPQQATITIISHYEKEDSAFWTPGETVLAKITLTTPVPAALLHGLEFNMAEIDGSSTRETVTGVVVDDIIVSKQSGNTIMQSDTFDTEALTPVVVKITNSRTQALDTLEVFVSDGIGGTYLTDFTLELYDEDFNKILGTHNNTEGTFTKDDSSIWSLAAGDTCYVVVKTTNETNDVFVRLM